VLLAAVLGAIALVASGYELSRAYFPLPPRYSIALVAPMAVVAASCLRTRTSVAIAAALSGAAVAASAVRLLDLV
jgi:membrane associated rhomboid family serine protease